MLYKEWLTEWLSNYVKPSVKDNTYSRYADVIQHHLIPRLGDYELYALTPLIVQRVISELLQSGNLITGKGLAPNSVNSIITVIQGSMSTANMLGLTDKYEMNKLRRQKQSRKRLSALQYQSRS